MLDQLTGHTRKQLSRKILDLTAGKRHKPVTLQEIKHTLPEQIGHDADVVPEIETIPKVDALVAVGLVVRGQGGQDA